MRDGMLAFGICFTGYRDVYCTGDVITGEVVMELGTATQIKGIDLCVSGSCDIHLHSKCTVKHWSTDDACPLHARETYFEKCLQLCSSNSANHDGETLFGVGRHVLCFEVGIPAISLPNSFEGELGYIRYVARSTLRTINQKYETKRAFTMLGETYDINVDTLKPFKTIRSYMPTHLFWCRGQSAIKVVVTLPRVAYFAGDAIPISMFISNDSGHKVKKISAELTQSMFCRVGRYTKSSMKQISSLDFKGINGQKQLMQINQFICIPAVAPSNLVNCDLIELVYELMIFVNVSTRLRRKKIVFRIPIEVNNVPLQDHADRDQNANNGNMKYETVFAECVNGPRCIREPGDSRDVSGHLHFTPVYRVVRPLAS